MVCYNPQNGLASTTPTWMSQEVSKGIPHLQVGELTPWYQPLILPSNRTSKNPLDIQTKDHAVRSLVHSLTNVRWRSSRLSDASPSPAGPAGPGGSSEATDYHHRNLGCFQAVGWLGFWGVIYGWYVLYVVKQKEVWKFENSGGLFYGGFLWCFFFIPFCFKEKGDPSCSIFRLLFAFFLGFPGPKGSVTTNRLGGGFK